MTARHPGFRIFVIGAGFSRLAGLPLATELFPLIKDGIERRYGTDTKFHRDFANYMEYRIACAGSHWSAQPIDLEDFMSFLDIEHYLQLRGSDTWSDEGNESQLLIRSAIGAVIHGKTPAADKLPSAYYKFAQRLSTNDLVLTFNYDVLLERALDQVRKPYRLFPFRLANVGQFQSVIDTTREEVVVLKLHGSVDWFDNRQFLRTKAIRDGMGSSERGNHAVFDEPRRYGATPVAEGPRSAGDLLLNVHRIKDVDAYYRNQDGFTAPVILAPSHLKFVYAEPLLSLWRGMNQSGGYNLGISVIGFSLPKHDEYIRVGLYHMISNYQQSWWDQTFLGSHRKDKVRFVDCQTDQVGILEYKERYGFVDQSKADYNFSGFNTDAVSFLFNDGRPV